RRALRSCALPRPGAPALRTGTWWDPGERRARVRDDAGATPGGGPYFRARTRGRGTPFPVRTMNSSPEPAAPAPTPAPRGACANCGTPLLGDHCYACGQPVKGLVRHFSSIVGDVLDSVFEWDARTPRTLCPL